VRFAPSRQVVAIWVSFSRKVVVEMQVLVPWLDE